MTKATHKSPGQKRLGLLLFIQEILADILDKSPGFGFYLINQRGGVRDISLPGLLLQLGC